MTTPRLENPTPKNKQGMAWRANHMKLTTEQDRRRKNYLYEQAMFELWASRGFRA